jgi:secreted trypsin-like serine protease
VRNLRFVEVPFVERAQCNRPFAYDGRITDEMICCRESEWSYQGRCQGDSGGPLTVTTSTNPMLAGIVQLGRWLRAAEQSGDLRAGGRNTPSGSPACTARPEECH